MKTVYKSHKQKEMKRNIQYISFTIVAVFFALNGIMFFCNIFSKSPVLEVEETIVITPIEKVDKEIAERENTIRKLPKKISTQKIVPTDYSPEVPKLDNDVIKYCKRFAHVAIAEQRKYGIPASIKLAQGILESRSGSSRLAMENNNHFGMKCFSKKCKKGHCTNHFDDHHKDFFRKYDNAWSSWRSHSKMLASGRYKVLVKHGNDYKEWAKGLKRLGYATDKKYANKIIGVIEKYELYKLDNLQTAYNQ